MPPQGQQPPRAPAAPAPPQSTPFQDAAIIGIFVLIVLIAFSAYVGGIFDWYRGIIGAFYTWWEGIRLFVGIFFAIVDAFLLWLIIRSIVRTRQIREAFDRPASPAPATIAAVPATPPTPINELRGTWKDIEQLQISENASDWNLAVIRADALFEQALLRMGFEGDGFSDRLNKVDPTRIRSIDEVWSAHRLRNTIAHNPAMTQYTKESIDYALQSYRRGLEELGVLQRSASDNAQNNENGEEQIAI